MREPLVKIQLDEARFGEVMRDYAAFSHRTFADEFRNQCRLIAAELVKHTPPFSGKVLSKMLVSRGRSFSDPDLAKDSAKVIGEKAIARDMARLFIKVKNWWNVKSGPRYAYLFSDAQNHYLTTADRFNPHPDFGWAEGIRRRFRTNKGRVNYKAIPETTQDGINTRKYPLPELTYDLLQQRLQRNVGEAKGGWAASYVHLGGKLSKGNWVGRHIGKGECRTNFKGDTLSVTMVNRSRWASGGDPDGIVHRATQQQGERMAREIRNTLTSHWGNKTKMAGVFE